MVPSDAPYSGESAVAMELEPEGARDLWTKRLLAYPLVALGSIGHSDAASVQAESYDAAGCGMASETFGIQPTSSETSGEHRVATPTSH